MQRAPKSANFFSQHNSSSFLTPVKISISHVCIITLSLTSIPKISPSEVAASCRCCAGHVWNGFGTITCDLKLTLPAGRLLPARRECLCVRLWGGGADGRDSSLCATVKSVRPCGFNTCSCTCCHLSGPALWIWSPSPRPPTPPRRPITERAQS